MTTQALGDTDGLVRLFLLFIRNRDGNDGGAGGNEKGGRRRRRRSTVAASAALVNGAGLLISKVGSALNYLRYSILMDNSERGGSLDNIHRHYDISNSLFETFLDKTTMMYSSAIYDYAGGKFSGTLDEAQTRKLDTLCSKACLPRRGDSTGRQLRLLDIGFGWGGLSIHAAKYYNVSVVGITLSVEQCKLATDRVKAEGLSHLIEFKIVDYRVFARAKENDMAFDRVISW